MPKMIVASLIGTSLEWYDVFLDGTASALVINELFFPQFDPVTGTSVTGWGASRCWSSRC